MTDTGESLGMEVIREIARQDMILAKPKRDEQGRHTGAFYFHWRGNSDEQLSAHIFHILRGRGLQIQRIPPSEIPDIPPGND